MVLMGIGPRHYTKTKTFFHFLLTIAAQSLKQHKLDPSQGNVQHHHHHQEEPTCEKEMQGDVDEAAHAEMESSLLTTYRVIMKGHLEKKGHSTAFFMWPKCVGYLGLCVVCGVLGILWG